MKIRADIDAEQSVLGSMLLDKNALMRGVELLQAGDFYREAHQHIFTALKAMAINGQDVDEITLTDQLRRQGKLQEVGSTEYLVALAHSVPTASNLESYATIVRRERKARQLIAAGCKLQALGQDQSFDGDLAAEASAVLMEITHDAAAPERSMLDVCMAATTRLQALTRGGDPRVIPFRMEALRNVLYGMGPGEFGVVVGPTGGGKTVELLDFASTAGSSDRPVLLVSLEMEAEDLVIRMMCADTSQNLHEIRQGEINWDRTVACLNDYSRYNIKVIDRRLSLSQLKIAATRWHDLNEAAIRAVGGLIVIDYFGIVRFDRRADNKVDAEGQMAADFKELARDLGVSVWTGVQVRKGQGNENNVNDRARGSGGIIHEADKVLMIEPQADPDEDHMQRVCLNVTKHRGGPVGRIQAMFNRRKLRIEEVTDHYDNYTPAGPITVPNSWIRLDEED